MTRIAFVLAYLIGLVAAVFGLDAGGGWVGTVMLGLSLLLGAGTGDFRLAALALLAVPIAIPFGLPTNRETDPVLPVWVAALYLAFFSGVLIVFAAFVRQIVESRLRRRRATRDTGVT